MKSNALLFAVVVIAVLAATVAPEVLAAYVDPRMVVDILLAPAAAVTLKGLRDKRGQLVADARAILDKAEADNKRALTDDEQKAFDKLIDEQGKVADQIKREEQLQEAERAAAASDLERRETEREAERGLPGARDKEVVLRALDHFMRSGYAELNADERRALQLGSDPAGGYMAPPLEFVNRLIQAVDDETFIRMKATKFTVTSSQAMGAPSLDADPADADWTTELGTGSEDSTMAFGRRELKPAPVAKRIKVSNKLLRTVSGVEGLVTSRLAYKFGITHEKAFLTGNGAGQPLGLFTASASGVPTSRDVSTDNLTTQVTFDGLINAKYALKGQYWSRAEWLFHRDALKQIAKLKDGEGQYLWRQSVREGEPDTILGRPLSMSEYVPNTFTTGLYVGMFADFSHYWICDALDMQFQRLVELYAETNQVGFIGRMESDGMPTLAEAFVRVKLA